MFEKLLNILRDNRIPKATVIRYSFLMFVRYAWGLICFRKRGIALAPSSAIFGKSLIRTSGRLFIDAGCYINATGNGGLRCGNNVIIGRSTTIACSPNPKVYGGCIEIGDNTSLGSHGFFGGMGGLRIGSDVLIGNYVSFHPENHVFSDPDTPIRKQGVSYKGGITIGDDCWIGAKATFLDGSRIGRGCVVAAGAVVTGSFPDNVIIGGVPAKIIRRRN